MKIKGPTSPGAPGVEKPTAPEATKGPEGAFAEKLGKTEKVGGPGGPTGPGAADPVARVHADLKAGSITPNQAVDRLMDLAVKQSGGAQLPDKVKAALKSQLESFIKDDPYLASRARRIGADVGGDDES